MNLAKLERFALVLVRNDRAAEKDPPVVAMFLHLEGTQALAIWWYPLAGTFAPEPYRHAPEHVLRRVREKDITPTLRAAHRAFVDTEIRIQDACRSAHGQACECLGCHPRVMR